jgi:hypothetical protein
VTRRTDSRRSTVSHSTALRCLLPISIVLMAVLPVTAVGWQVASASNRPHSSPLSTPGTAAKSRFIPSVVAWKDAPVATPDPSKWAATLPQCRASQLTARSFPSGGTAGSVVFRAEIVNHSHAVCALRGHPLSLSGVTSGGSFFPLQPQWLSDGVPYVTDQPAILPVGGSADMAIIAGVNCLVGPPSGPSFAALVIGVPSGRVSAPFVNGTDGGGQPTEFPCGLAVTPFARWDESEGQGAHFSGTMALDAILPPSFELLPGHQRLDYAVSLVNPGGLAVRLDPCPTYTETLTLQTSLGKAPGPAIIRVASYRLNCKGASDVPPHSRIRYRIQIAVPDHPRRPYSGNLEWRLDVLDGTGPEASSYWCGACLATR